ncbi:MAG: hypothetical protein GC155_17025, partial [Alphaproteobacteria bacterium]|nr:hypothetical protein [Alphaproteobacteria bacterium]
MLVLLVAAFGGALALKAWEERKDADRAILVEQSRNALAISGQVRAELVSSRARMEGLLLGGASLDAIRRGVPFDAVGERSPSNGAWAQLADQNSVRVYAQSNDGTWVSGLRSSQSLLPALDGHEVTLVSMSNSPPATMFKTVNGRRTALACSPISGSDLGACVSGPAPIIDLGDLNRAFMYLLLLAAPALAVTGLLQAIAKLHRARENDAERAKEALSAAARIDTAFEVSGTIGFWRWDPESQLLTLSPQAAALLGAMHSGDMTLDEF